MEAINLLGSSDRSIVWVVVLCARGNVCLNAVKYAY